MGWPTSRWRPATSAGAGVGVNPLRGQNNVQGSCDMGSFPHEFPGYRHVSDDAVRAHLREGCGALTLDTEPGLRIPNMFDAAARRAPSRAFTSRARISLQSDPNTKHVSAALAAMECVVVQDLFLNETAKLRACVPAGLVLPRKGWHLHQCRAAHRAGAQGDEPEERLRRLGNYHGAIDHAMGFPDELRRIQARSWTRSRRRRRLSRVSPSQSSMNWARSKS